MHNDEKFWIEHARRGDDSAFTHLVELYQRQVFNLCYRMLGDPGNAEDAAQETFIRAYLRLDSYDPNRKFSSWLLAIASHYCIDRLRQRRFGLVSWDELLPCHWLSDPKPGPEDMALRYEAQQRAQTLLDTLAPDYRAAVVLRYWYDFSYKEIAEALNSSVPAIKSRLFRARQTMAQAAAHTEAVAAGHSFLSANYEESTLSADTQPTWAPQT